MEQWFDLLAPDGKCVRWTGTHVRGGYGQVSVDGRILYVHRVAYETQVGPIPDEHEIDHVWKNGCRFRDCVLPEHLEPVTRIENNKRMWEHRERQTACSRGHEFTEENTYVHDGRRHCRTCRRDDTRRRRARRGGDDQRLGVSGSSPDL